MNKGFVSNNQKEIIIIVISFVLLALFSISSKFYGIFEMKKLNQMTLDIYAHPLQVTNAALNVKLNVTRIHRDINEILLIDDIEAFNSMIVYVNKREGQVYQYLEVIRKNIIGEDGIKLFLKTKELMNQWKPIREKMIYYKASGQKNEAISYSKWESSIHVLRLEEMTSKLYEYAQAKATRFKNDSQRISDMGEKTNLTITILLILLFILIAYYVIKRISRYVILLNNSKKDLEKILNESPYPIMVFSEDGSVILINYSWMRYTGYVFDEINTIAKWTKNAYGKEKNDLLENIDGIKNNTHVDSGEYTIKTKNGKELVWKFTSSYIGRINDKDTIISSAVDITELREKDKFIVSQSRHAAMGEMISMIAHQWRQPITTISMIANNILLDIDLEEIDNDNFKAYSKSILTQTDHLSNTIEDFRNFFKKDKELLDVYIDDIFKNVFNILGNSLEIKSIKLIYTCKSQSKVNVYPREMAQVLINIINNAKDILLDKTTTDKVIEIDVHKIDVLKTEDFVNITICDNGGGIPNDIIDRIFEPYFTTKDSNGTGLGLYMSKMIVEEHFDGHISANNTDKGACLSIAIPTVKE